MHHPRTMGWSFELVRAFGVDIRVHALFGLVVLWEAALAFSDTPTVTGVVSVIAFIGALFFFVVPASGPSSRGASA